MFNSFLSFIFLCGKTSSNVVRTVDCNLDIVSSLLLKFSKAKFNSPPLKLLVSQKVDQTCGKIYICIWVNSPFNFQLTVGLYKIKSSEGNCFRQKWAFRPSRVLKPAVKLFLYHIISLYNNVWSSCSCSRDDLTTSTTASRCDRTSVAFPQQQSKGWGNISAHATAISPTAKASIKKRVQRRFERVSLG